MFNCSGTNQIVVQYGYIVQFHNPFYCNIFTQTEIEDFSSVINWFKLIYKDNLQTNL